MMRLYKLGTGKKVDIVSNPEFLREGSAVRDTFFGDRIVIGAVTEWEEFIDFPLNKIC